MMKTGYKNELYIITYPPLPKFTAMINELIFKFNDRGYFKQMLIKRVMEGDGFYVKAFLG